MAKGLTITVTFRKRDTGYNVWSFQTDKLDWARTAAQLLVDSPTFRNCFAVAISWSGDIMFECRPSEQAPPPPVPVQAPQYASRPVAQMHGYGAPPPPMFPSPEERMRQAREQHYSQRGSYGPPPAPRYHAEEIVVHAEVVQRPSHRSAYGPPPPLPHNVPKMLKQGQ